MSGLRTCLAHVDELGQGVSKETGGASFIVVALCLLRVEPRGNEL